MKSSLLALPATLVVGLVALAWLSGEGTAQDVTPVEVVNLPKVQTVNGAVTVDEPVPHSRFVRLERVIVAPIARSESTSLEPAAVVDTAGFTHVVLSLRGESQGKLSQDGPVGALLLPDQEGVTRSFREAGRFEFALGVEAAATRGERGYFAGGPARHPVAFPQYRVLLYNETDRSAEVDLYLYLTN